MNSKLNEEFCGLGGCWFFSPLSPEITALDLIIKYGSVLYQAA